MKNISKDELLKLLKSQDKELVKLCIDYICNNFNIDFFVYEHRDTKNQRIRLSRNLLDLTPLLMIKVSDLLEILKENRFYLTDSEKEDLINIIIEYNKNAIKR